MNIASKIIVGLKLESSTERLSPDLFKKICSHLRTQIPSFEMYVEVHDEPLSEKKPINYETWKKFNGESMENAFKKMYSTYNPQTTHDLIIMLHELEELGWVYISGQQKKALTPIPTQA